MARTAIKSCSLEPFELSAPYTGILAPGEVAVVSTDVETTITNLGGVSAIRGSLEVYLVPDSSHVTYHDHSVSVLPLPHATTHTTGADQLSDAAAGGAHGLMTGGDKDKLDHVWSAAQSLTGAGAVDVVHRRTYITANGVGNALTLADGAILGQQKTIILFASTDIGNTAILTPTNFAGGGNITLATIGDYIELEWNGAAWAKADTEDKLPRYPEPFMFDLNLHNTTRLTNHPRYERNSSVFKDTAGKLWLWWCRCLTLKTRQAGDVDNAYYEIVYSTSLDGGVTWAAPYAFNQTLPALFSPRELSFNQDGTGLYWLHISNGCSGSPQSDRLMHVFTTTNGLTWTNVGPVVITGWATNPANIGHAQVIFAGSKFRMAFQQRSSNSVYYSDSADGVNFGTAVTIQAATYLIPKICFIPGTPNRILIVSTKGSAINLALSTDDGVSFTKADIITHAGAYDPCVGVSADGNLLLVFAPNIGADGQQLKYSVNSSGAGGELTSANWSTPLALTKGQDGAYEWWDYWPFLFVDGKATYIFYSSEHDLAGRVYQGCHIYAMTWEKRDLIEVKDEGSKLGCGIRKLNFVGSAVSAAVNGSDPSQVDVTVSAGGGTKSRVRAYKSVKQTIPFATPTKVTFDVDNDAYSFDVDNEFASSTFTAKRTGYFDIAARIAFDGTFTQYCVLKIVKNGTLPWGQTWTTPNTTPTTNQVHDLVYLAVGNTIEIFVLHMYLTDSRDTMFGQSDTYLTISEQ